MLKETREFVEIIKEKNTTRAEDKSKQIFELIRPIRDEMDDSEKSDEVLIVKIYVRKGNDILTTGRTCDSISTTLVRYDTLIMDSFTTLNGILDDSTDD